MVIAGIQGMTLERIERGPTAERKRARELFIPQRAGGRISHSR